MDPEYQAAADALRVFYLRTQRVLDRIMTARGASFARAKVLMYIAPEGWRRSTDIATFFGYAPRTVTEAVDGLERDGLVRREPDPDDRRAKRIVLTAAGKIAAENAEAARREFVASVFGVLDPAERETFVGLFARLNTQLAALGG